MTKKKSKEAGEEKQKRGHPFIGAVAIDFLVLSDAAWLSSAMTVSVE